MDEGIAGIPSDVERARSDLKVMKLATSKKDEVQGNVFLDKDDRLKRIKGMILSAINKAINDKDAKAMKELKKLVEKLEGELF